MGISEGFMCSFDYRKTSIIKFDPAWFSKHWVLKRGGPASQIQMWGTWNLFLRTVRKLFMSRSSAEASPLLQFEHWLLVSFGVERRHWCASCLWAGTSTHLQMNQEVQDRAGCTCLMYSIICPVMLFGIVKCASQLQVLREHQTWCETRAAGTGSGSLCRVPGEHGQAHFARAAGSPGAAKESQSSFTYAFLNRVTTAEEI